MELQGYDARLAVAKINDFLETLSDANISITYANKEEHSQVNENELKVIRRIHTRHAIIDLNNSFDLLLQIPWFFYRIWNEFNQSGNLYISANKKYQNTRYISRTTGGWVEDSEKNCNYFKVLRYFENQSDEKAKKFRNKLTSFNKFFVTSKSKPFTIRTLANQMKHNHSLKLQEFYSAYDYNVNFQDKKTINLRKNQLGMNLSTEFFYIHKPHKTLGKIKVEYWDDLYIDIEYYNGEKFIAKDYMKENQRYSLDSIYKEMIEFGNNLIDLYESIFELIESQITFNPLLNNKSTNKSVNPINLDKYFKSKV